MTSSSLPSFSFQPWIRNNNDQNSLKDILTRVNLERGHFRDITETSLQEEIAAEGGLEVSGSDESEDNEEDDEEDGGGRSKPANREELFKAKFEMLANVSAAEQEVLMALDFVSLLLSKDAPKQAALTMSQHLKENVPAGSLGTDLWQRMPVDKAREAQDEILATSVRLEGLQKSADGLMAAAGRLKDNVRQETEYWNQILMISENGWNVCRMPGRQSKLGVRFGFSESSAEFSRRGVAPLHAAADGTITLDRGVGSKPKGLHAVLRRNGEVVGTSKLQKISNAEDTTLEERIRYARDSLYDEELYHEMIRESRTLASLGVMMDDSTIKFNSVSALQDDTEVSLDLVPLDDHRDTLFSPTNAGDRMAQAIVLAARLLLSQAHREKLKKRSEIPTPLSNKKQDERPILPILRPIMSFVMHQSAIAQLNTYIETITSTLQNAKIETTNEPAQLQLPTDIDITKTETLIGALMRPLASEAHLKIQTPEDRDLNFSLRVETTLAYTNSFGPAYTLTTPNESSGYRFDTFDSLSKATDTKLASELAKALGRGLGEGWECVENEALLIRDSGVGEKALNIWAQVKTARRALELNSLLKKRKWVVGGESEDESESDEGGFWEVVGGIVEEQQQ